MIIDEKIHQHQEFINFSVTALVYFDYVNDYFFDFQTKKLCQNTLDNFKLWVDKLPSDPATLAYLLKEVSGYSRYKDDSDIIKELQEVCEFAAKGNRPAPYSGASVVLTCNFYKLIGVE